MVLERNSTVGAIRGSSSGPPRCRPPMIYLPSPDDTKTEELITYHVNRFLKCFDGIFYNVDDACVRTADSTINRGRKLDGSKSIERASRAKDHESFSFDINRSIPFIHDVLEY